MKLLLLPRETALALLGLTFLTSASAQITTGFDFFCDAGQDDGLNNKWEDLTVGNPTGQELWLDDSPAVTRVAVTGSSTNLTHAYDFPGGSTGNNAGAFLVATGTTSTEGFSDSNDGNWSTVDVTMEIWFKPDNLTPAPANGQIIFEDGGGTGLGLFIDNNELVVGHDGNTNLIAYNLNTDTLGVLSAAATSDFVQAVITHDTGSPFQTVLYINGVQVGTSNDDSDWSGGDGVGFGARGEANTGGRGNGDASTQSFDGQIALIRAYRAQILTPAEVLANFDELSGPDLDPPTLSNLDPADDATGVYPGTNLVATFNEDIALTGTGTITITDTDDGSGNQVISLPDASVTVSGADLIIDPGTNFEFGTNYEVVLDGLAIEDVADTPNAYGGTTSGDWTFTSVAQDLTPPVVSTFLPADEEPSFLPLGNLVVTFDESILTGTGNIVIKNLDTLSDTTIAVTDASQVSISGAILTIDPTSDLDPSTNYAIQMDSGVVKNFSEFVFGGIADNTTWNFTTSSLTVTYIGDNATNSDRWNQTGSWDLGVVPDGAFNVIIPPGKITTVWSDSTPTYTGDFNIGAGSTLQIGWTTNRPNSYNAVGTAGSTIITMGAGALIKGRTSGSPNMPAIVLTGDAKHRLGESTQAPASPTYGQPITGPYAFTIESNTAPTATLAATNTFSELIISAISGRGGNHGTVKATAAGSLGTGDVTTISSDGNKSLKIEFDVSNAMSATGTLTLNGKGPSGNGANRVQMDANNTIGFLSVDGFPRLAGTYGRIGTPASVTYEVAWMSGDSILTVDSQPVEAVAPSLTTLYPADDSLNYGIISDLILTFDEPMAVGNGNILIKNLTDLTTETIPVTDSSRVSVSETQVTVNPTLDGIFGKNYAVQIDVGALTDLFGNPYAGIADDTTWNFTAASPPVGVVLVDNDFEGATLEDWTASGADAGLYQNGDVVSNMSAADALIDYAPTGDYSMWDGRGGNTLILTNPLILKSFGYESVTISFNHNFRNGSGTRRIYTAYSADNGASWQDLGFVTNSGSGSYTLSNSSYNFTDQAKFRFAFGDSGGAAGPAFIDDVLITGVVDTAAPTVAPFVDNQSGGPVNIGDPVVYTLTFSEPMSPATIGTDDFENVAGAGIIVDSVTATADPAIYTVTVTPTSVGDLILQIKAGAVLGDSPLQNLLDTTSAITDDTTITVEAAATDPYSVWASGFSPNPGLPTDNPDSDSLTNLLEFAFGTDPTISDAGQLVADGTVNGVPIVQSSAGVGITFDFLFVQRTDAGDSGSVTYTPQFSNELGVWFNSTVTPTVVAAASTGYEVVSVPYPPTLPNGKKARFARMEVVEVP